LAHSMVKLPRCLIKKIFGLCEWTLIRRLLLF
jgi:hypothetical protein